MSSLPDETLKEIHEIINNRISKAPTSIKSNFGFQYRNQKPIIEEIGNTLLIALLSPNEKKSLKWRQKKGIQNFPYIITESKIVSLFRLEGTKNFMVRNLNLEDCFLFSMGQNSSAIVENFTAIIPKTHVGPIKYTIDLGFIIRPHHENSLYSITEILDDLVVYYIKNKRAITHDLSI